MITGFNTDIEFAGVTYHVQTEDKGLAKPMILSLVYDGGTILASKRSPYEDLLKDGFDETVLAERLQKQHALICAAVRSGRIEDLKKMTQRESAKARGGGGAAVTAPQRSDAYEPAAAVSAPPTFEMPIPKPSFGGFDHADTLTFDEPYLDVIEISDEDLIFPDDAIEIINEPFVSEAAPASNALSIELLGNLSLKGGDRLSIGFLVCRGNANKVVGEAQVMVKILGSSFRPVIFHSSTDANGIARVNVQVPSFSSGRAVFLVRAISGGEEVELRRPVAHG